MSDENQPIPFAGQVPRATYRLQFNEHFRLSDGLALVPYLRELGVSHVYASPLLRAIPHSTHGYDVCDFGRLNPEIGSESELERFVQALREHGMGLVLDIVPNHMGIGGPQNRWWWNVLTFGPASRFAEYFDIDWKSPDPRLRGKVFLPILGDHYARVLERGDLKLAEENGAVVLRYFDQRLPINPSSLPEEDFSIEGPSPEMTAAIGKINANAYALDNVIRQQYYVPASWREADTGLNYRRFFTITSLAGLRTEVEQVFNDSHALIREWVQKGWVQGLRVDHPDGLRDPAQYLKRLRDLAPNAWIVIEKILQSGESLPSSWPVAGTTGYDFANRVGGLFIDPNGERELNSFYAEFTDEPGDYAALAGEKKRLVLRRMLAPELNRLAELLGRITEQARPEKKFPRDQLREALIEVAACFPVYRTYLQPETGAISKTDIAYIEQAVGTARNQRPRITARIFEFLNDLLHLKLRGDLANDFVSRFQQLTVSAMAKGVEDCAFYCFNRLIALNEVGGDPGCFGLSIQSFHEVCHAAQKSWPDSMLATATHDTKRGEDVRARLDALSEIPDTWCAAVRRWSAMNEAHRRDGWPDRNAEYFFYQTLAGAWPLSEERAWACMEKSVRESGQYSTWSHPHAAYESALREFISGVLGSEEFTGDLENFLTPVIEAGHVNSLSQTLIKLTAPGVPDIYQGCELWDFSLVDPDNRRPVDFALRQKWLAESKQFPTEEIWRRRNDGLPKLWLIRKTLELRARQPEWFRGSSSYEPLLACGEKSDHVVAFVRGGNAITVAQRLPMGLKNNWGDTKLELPLGKWRNEFGDETVFENAVSLKELLRKFPVGLLVRKEAL